MSSNNHSKYYVISVKGGWSVKKDCSSRSSGLYSNQETAVSAAKEAVRRQGGGELKVQTSNGRWKSSYTMGRYVFEKFSAVEELYPPREMKADFKRFDTNKSSPTERREFITNKYAPKAK